MTLKIILIKYSYTGLQGESSYKNPILEVFQHFTSSFDINISRMALRLQDFHTKIEGCEYMLKNYFAKQQQRFTEINNARMERFQSALQQKVDEVL